MTSPITVDGIEGVKSMVGKEVGPTDWVEVTQEMVNLFADATGDHQWIHVDVERAKKESPFGGPIAHGYLTLSLLVPLVSQTYTVTDASMGVNYGLNKVRFPAPVPVGAKLRAKAVIDEVTDIKGGVQVLTTVTFEVEGSPKPACVAASVVRQLV